MNHLFQVVAGTISAKTDRLEGIVDFTQQEVRTKEIRAYEMMTSGLMTTKIACVADLELFNLG